MVKRVVVPDLERDVGLVKEWSERFGSYVDYFRKLDERIGNIGGGVSAIPGLVKDVRDGLCVLKEKAVASADEIERRKRVAGEVKDVLVMLQNRMNEFCAVLDDVEKNLGKLRKGVKKSSEEVKKDVKVAGEVISDVEAGGYFVKG